MQSPHQQSFLFAIHTIVPQSHELSEVLLFQTSLQSSHSRSQHGLYQIEQKKVSQQIEQLLHQKRSEDVQITQLVNQAPFYMLPLLL